MGTQARRILTITILFVGFVINVAISQEYSLRSFSSGRMLIQTSLNDGKQILSITCPTDTIYIRDVDDVKTAKVLNNTFLMIVYHVRAGSGMHLMRTLLLSGSNNKICESLNIASLFKEEFLDFNKHVTSPMKVEVNSIYDAKLFLREDDSKNYKLSAKIHDERSSAHAPKTNYNNSSLTTLNFDKNLHIFYSSHEHMAGYFTIFDPKTQKEVKQYINSTLPVAKLGKYKYYYKKNVWYERFDSNLTKCSYK